MRDIKFKVWHPEQKAMYWFDLMWGNKWYTGSGWLCVVPWGEKRVHHPDNRWEISLTDVEIMQFTGLHDKDDREIYEGDIIETRHTQVKPLVMVFRDGGFVPSGDHATEVEGLGLIPDNSLCRECRIIGNIHQNPELLQQQGGRNDREANR